MQAAFICPLLPQAEEVLTEAEINIERVGLSPILADEPTRDLQWAHYGPKEKPMGSSYSSFFFNRI